jgi:hypothetical protein
LDRYYHVETLLVDRFHGTTEKRMMGLVGLHIVQKTPSRPQWIWSTFEHVDNVEVGPGAPPGSRPSFNNPDEPQTGPGINDLPPAIHHTNLPDPDPKPVQVRRIPTIAESTQKTNQLYQNHALVRGTVWKNYQLVATQWPTDPKSLPRGTPFPRNQVANVTMETKFQSTSCIGCHGSSLPTDFVWVLTVRAYPVTENGVMPAVKALRENLSK